MSGIDSKVVQVTVRERGFFQVTSIDDGLVLVTGIENEVVQVTLREQSLAQATAFRIWFWKSPALRISLSK